jgi:predicted patatin/cPLA2 family phospholipase
VKALVIAGGGTRGAYASGAAIAIHELGLKFDAVYGTSAGGAVAAWFTAGQPREGLRTWRYVQDPTIMNWRRWLTFRGPLIDLERLYGEVYTKEVGLDLDAIRNAPHPTIVTMADAESGHAHYVDLRKADILQALKASSAIPFVTDAPFEFNGRKYFDGGLVQPVPLERALEDGAKEVVLIFNHHPEYDSSTSLFMAWLFERKYPRLGLAIAHHSLLYDQVEALAANPPVGVKITLIRPLKDHGVHRLTRDTKLIERAIDQGRKDAFAALA